MTKTHGAAPRRRSSLAVVGARGARKALLFCLTPLAVVVVPLLGHAAGLAAAATPPDRLVFGINPALLGKTPLGGKHFNYALGAGAEVEDGVVLSNFTPTALTLHVYATDLLQAQGGGRAPAQEGPQRFIGAWLHIERKTVIVPAFGSVTDHFILTVPHWTPPGGYYGAVVVARNAGVTTNGVTIQTRAALLVDLTVPGHIRVALRMTKPVAKRVGSGYVFATRIVNRGNVLVGLARAITRLRFSGHNATLVLHPGGLYLLPGKSVTLTTASYKYFPVIGTVRAKAHTEALVNGAEAGRYYSPTLVMHLFPWLVATWGVAGIGAIAAGLLLGRRRIERWWANWREERQLVSQLRQQRRASRNQ